MQLSDSDIACLSVVLARMWGYPPNYASLIHGNLLLARKELADPARRQDAEQKAREAGLHAADN